MALILLFSFQSLLSANTMPDQILSYFSDGYPEARGKFINAVGSNGGQIDSYQHPITGPNGETLFLDVASFGPQSPQSFLVLGSGTHGVEGFAGSAIQTGLLLQGIVAKLPPNVGLLLIHAINPYGFAHLRRFNEDNIDLNRNFIDHSKPHPLNEGYKQLASSILPQSLSFWSDAKSIINLLRFLLKHGRSELQQAISSGQFTHPDGLFYGGVKTAWSNKTIRMIASRYLSKTEKVILIDFHTGLGDYGNAEVIMNVCEKSLPFQRAKEWWGSIVRSTVVGKSVSVHLKGALKQAFPQMLPKSEVTAVSLEFGTIPAKNVLWALRSENWLHHQGIDYPKREEIKANLLRAFYPDDDNWKLEIWEKGGKVVEQVLNHL